MVHFTRTVEEFRQIAPIAAAQGLGVVNGGYTYDADLVARCPRYGPGTGSPSSTPTPSPRTSTRSTRPPSWRSPAFLATARTRLDPLGCDVVLRAFHPSPCPRCTSTTARPGTSAPRATAEEQADALWATSSARCAAPHRAPGWSSTTTTRWSAGSRRSPTRR